MSVKHWFETKDGTIDDAELAASLEEDGLVADFVADAREWAYEHDRLRKALQHIARDYLTQKEAVELAQAALKRE